jgi:hypothetical protein
VPAGETDRCFDRPGAHVHALLQCTCLHSWSAWARLRLGLRLRLRDRIRGAQTRVTRGCEGEARLPGAAPKAARSCQAAVQTQK